MTGTETDALSALHDEGWDVLEWLGRSLRVKDPSLQATLEAILARAVEVIDGAEHAGLNLYVAGKFEPQAVLGRAPLALDELQKALLAGPCIDASHHQVVVHVEDMRHERRWAEFAERAVELDVLSMLCVPLWIDDVRLGSLSLYARSPYAFGEPGGYRERLAALLAMHGAIALADAQRAENLRIALRSRDVIGQAKGILMERQRITAEAAFEILVHASQRTNRKLVAIAEDVVMTGAVPG